MDFSVIHKIMMANEASMWNAKMSDTPPGQVIPDIDLSQRRLDGFDLSNSVLEHINLVDARLYDCCFKGAMFHEGNLQGTLLRACELDGAQIFDSISNEMTLSSSSARGLIIEEGEAASLHFSDVNCSEGIFDHVNLADGRFWRVDFEGLKVVDCNLAGSHFFGCNLRNASFQSSSVGVLFFGCDFSGADLALLADCRIGMCNWSVSNDLEQVLSSCTLIGPLFVDGKQFKKGVFCLFSNLQGSQSETTISTCAAHGFQAWVMSEEDQTEIFKYFSNSPQLPPPAIWIVECHLGNRLPGYLELFLSGMAGRDSGRLGTKMLLFGEGAQAVY